MLICTGFCTLASGGALLEPRAQRPQAAVSHRRARVVRILLVSTLVYVFAVQGSRPGECAVVRVLLKLRLSSRDIVVVSEKHLYVLRTAQIASSEETGARPGARSLRESAAVAATVVCQV